MGRVPISGNDVSQSVSCMCACYKTWVLYLLCLKPDPAIQTPAIWRVFGTWSHNYILKVYYNKKFVYIFTPRLQMPPMPQCQFMIMQFVLKIGCYYSSYRRSCT